MSRLIPGIILVLTAAVAAESSDVPLDKALRLNKPVIRNEVAGFLKHGQTIVLQREGRIEAIDRNSGAVSVLPLKRWGLVSPDETRLFDPYDASLINLDGTGRVKPAGELDPLYQKFGWTPKGNILLFRGNEYSDGATWDERLKCRMTEFQLTGPKDNALTIVREKDFPFNPLENDVMISPAGNKAAVQFGQAAPYWIKLFDLSSGAGRTIVQSERATTIRPVLHFWSPDGSSFLYSWNGLYLASTNGSSRLITKTNCEPIAFSPDGRTILMKKLLMKGSRLLESDLYQVDLEGKNVRQVTSHPKKIEGSVYWPDPDDVVYSDTTDYKKEFFRLLRLK
jgi:hypothetical protein